MCKEAHVRLRHLRLQVQYIVQYLFDLHEAFQFENTGKWSLSATGPSSAPSQIAKEIVPSSMTTPTRQSSDRRRAQTQAYVDKCQSDRPSPHSLTTAHYS